MNDRSKRWLRRLAILLLLAVLALLAAAVLLSMLPLENAQVVINDRTISLHGLSAGDAAIAVCLGAVVLVCALLIVAFILVLAAFVACLGIAVGAVASAASVAIALSPLFMIAWGVLWLARSPKAGSPTRGSPMATSS